ncbi:hypothetical protein YPPY98_1828, partial [Yersinia pestis PY-98]
MLILSVGNPAHSSNAWPFFD